MTERTPLVGGGGSINSTGGGSSFLATINDADEDLLGVESGDSVGKGHEENTKNELGYINGVYVPCLLNILGAVLFMRIGYSIGYAGWFGTLLIFFFSEWVTVLTALSFSKIVTNGSMGGGGTAFVEDIVDTFLSEYSDHDQHIYGLYIYHGTMFILMLIALVGAGAFAKVNTLLFVALFTAILTTFGSLLFMQERVLENIGEEYHKDGNCTKMDLKVPNEWHGNLTFYRPTAERFRENFWWVGHGGDHNQSSPDYVPSWQEYQNNIVTVLALIFTSTCGVMEGANLSGDLKDPAKALPKGTLLAKCTSFSTYIIFATLLASCFDRNALQCEYLVLQKAAISPYFVVVGIAMACLSTSLGALFGAARIMQAIARDDILGPTFSNFFSKGAKKGDEPQRAVVVTWLFTNVFAYLGNNSVAGIADILTDFFLTAYALVNLSQALLELSKAPNYRPTFKWATWYSSLSAFFLSVALMWYLQPMYAAITTSIWFLLYFIIYFTADEKDWGDISQGILFRQITTRLKDLVQRKDCAKFWRSSILVLTQEQDLPLLELCKHLTKDGLFIIGTAHVDQVMAGAITPNALAPATGIRKRTMTQSMLPIHRSRVAVVKATWLWLVEQTKLNAFVSVGGGANIIDTFRTMISSAGLGGLIPNTVVVPFRDVNRPPARLSNYVARIDEGLESAARRRKGKNQRVSSKSGVAFCCVPPSTCNVCNHPDSQNSQLGCASNLDYLRLLQHAIDYEKNVMVVRNSKDLDAVFGGLRAKHKVTPTFVDVWIVGEWDMASLEDNITLLLQHAHLMKAALGKLANLRILQVVHFFSEEKLRVKHQLEELVALARIPMPELVVVEAPPQEAGSSGSGSKSTSIVSGGTEISFANYGALNTSIFSHSGNTSLAFMAMPGLPDDLGNESADVYMAGLQTLTRGLPPTALILKGDPSPVFSTNI
eukprot:gene7597-152_t